MDSEISSMPAITHSVYIDAPVDRVFETLTTAKGWDAWFTEGTTLDARSGGFIQLRWVNFGSGKWTTEDGGPVVDVLPNERFAFLWSPAGHPTTVSFTLVTRGPGTVVSLREDGYLLTDYDLEALVGCSVGWGEALSLLKFYLEHDVTYGPVPEE